MSSCYWPADAALVGGLLVVLLPLLRRTPSLKG